LISDVNRRSLFPNDSLNFKLVQIKTEAETWGALNRVGGQWTICGALRRFLWFTVISAFAYGGGTVYMYTTIAAYVRITWRQRERGGRERERKARRGGQKSRVALSVYRAVFAVTFNPARCLSLFLSFATSLLSS